LDRTSALFLFFLLILSLKQNVLREVVATAKPQALIRGRNENLSAITRDLLSVPLKTWAVLELEAGIINELFLRAKLERLPLELTYLPTLIRAVSSE
jgi:hypothetical protein